MQDIGKLILRVSLGAMMLGHGYPKLMKLLEGGDIQWADPIGLGPAISLTLAVFAEFVCSILLIVGYKTKWATIPLIATMAVAVFIVHWDDPWGKKEFALLYAVGFIAIGLIGAGKYSLDDRFSKYQ